ncbi:Histidine kinase-like protein [Ectocarpus siliculosus]|uniref:histidine kinase n=1 Tax=Ectocarpus siliculosus TaxID=2880 RepID=D8LP35_ECTSI|nr:Histidine kinase-like protein [Ectocarpus siliculosus]|eukprot:CBN80306.1 Histidine kinase-like protein [Ectocarpus siliculosus]
MAEYLSAAHYDVFTNSSQFMAIYDSDKEMFVELNGALKTRMGSAPMGTIKVLVTSEKAIYLTLSGIPCRLQKIVNLTPHVHIVEIFPAHTKTWEQSSDLVQLTDLTSDGVWEWFPPLNFEYMSQRYWDILGYDQKEMHEKQNAWMDLIHPDDLQRVLKMSDDHVESKGNVPYHATVRYTHKNGNEVFVLCRGTIVDWLPDGTPWRMLGTHTDVTDIVKKDAVEAQSVFIARMSHEIRSPICSILNECELLQNEAQTSVISRTCQQLIALTDDILSLGDSKSNALQLEQKEVILQSVLSQCNKRHRLEAKKKGIRVKLSMGDLPDIVLMDETRFNQILDNLMNNAIKYSDSGAITIDVDYDYDDHVCEIRVQDHGHGIPAAMHAKVFEEFVQGDKTMQGAGIGLTLTKTMSSLMGGDVVIEDSKEGVGTTMLFTSILPLPDDGACSDKKKRCVVNILIVDDMRTNRSILTRRLACMEKLGIRHTQITEAVDGRDACEKFVAGNGDFQLILMDCLMPVLDGFEATSTIHNHCARMGIEPVPVVAVTASVSSDIREKCLNHGMKFVVTKPYTEQDLLLSVQACLQNSIKYVT